MAVEQIRYEEDEVTLRLFAHQHDAASAPGATKTARHATGWVALNVNGRWMDAVGAIPNWWAPVNKNTKGARNEGSIKGRFDTLRR